MSRINMETRAAGVVADGDGADGAVAWWRRAWRAEVAAADAQALGDGDPRLATRRRDYGSYLFIVVDLVLAFVVANILSIPVVVGAVILFVVSGHSLTTTVGQRDLQTVWLQSAQFTLAALVATDAGVLLVLWYRRSRLRAGWRLFGLGADLRRGAGRAVLIGLLLGVVALVLSSAVDTLLQRLGVYRTFHLDQNAQQKQLIDPLRHAPLWAVWGVALAGTFVAPVAEELLFRGYIFRALAVRKGVPVAYVLSAFTFAAFHLLPAQFLPLFVVGFVLCFAYHRTGNLLADITAHAFNNGVAFALSLLSLPFHF